MRIAEGAAFAQWQRSRCSRRLGPREGVMFERVMVPIDGSLLAEEAIATAAAIAKHSGAALELARVHVAYPYELYDNDRWNDEWRTEERAYLARKATSVEEKFGIPVHTAL